MDRATEPDYDLHSMDDLGVARVTDPASHRSRVAAGITVALHIGLLLAVAWFAGPRATRPPALVGLTPVELVEPPPAAPQPPAVLPPTGVRVVKDPVPGTLGRRGHDAPQRSQAPVVSDPRNELSVHYDAPASLEAGNPAGTIGTGIGASLMGEGTGDIGQLEVPPPPRSQARPARPKHDYTKWEFRADPRYAGRMVRIGLKLDADGRVLDAMVIESVDGPIDLHALDFARRFEFYPALNDTGTPIPSSYVWEFVIVAATTNGVQFLPPRH